MKWNETIKFQMSPNIIKITENGQNPNRKCQTEPNRFISCMLSRNERKKERSGLGKRDFGEEEPNSDKTITIFIMRLLDLKVKCATFSLLVHFFLSFCQLDHQWVSHNNRVFPFAVIVRGSFDKNREQPRSILARAVKNDYAAASVAQPETHKLAHKI